MQKPLRNYAFIDSQNVNLGIRDLGWKLDWNKFRVYLKEKYGVETAYMFIGYMEENQDLYLSLQKSGYILIFKEILKNKDGFVKGNCDAELVLQAMVDYQKYSKAVVVSGDGDFACLVRHLRKQGKLEKVLVPNSRKYSALLKKVAAEEYLDCMNNLKGKLFYTPTPHTKGSAKPAQRKAPNKDRTSKGSFRRDSARRVSKFKRRVNVNRNRNFKEPLN